jgi:hypothetical protein
LELASRFACLYQLEKLLASAVRQEIERVAFAGNAASQDGLPQKADIPKNNAAIEWQERQNAVIPGNP